VLFIDASQGFESGKNQNRLRDGDIEKIVKTYQAYRVTDPLNTEEGVVVEDKFAYRATLAEIEENDFNLNIPRYVDTFEEEEPVDIAAAQKELKDLKSELAEVEKRMEDYLTELGLP
jgi:type I restriction enzyme M protein